LGEVDLELRESGIRSWRIAHTRSVLREALDSAALQARLAITETTQPAAVIVALAAQPPSGLAARRSNGVSGDDLQRRRQRARDAALDLAERLQGRLGDLDGETFIVHTNRGAIEGAVVRRAMGHGGPLAPERLPADVVIGMGIGATVPGAEENARRALLMGERDGELHLAAADGSVMRVGRDGPVETLHLRETDQAMTQLARQLGFGPLALTRLTRALRQVDASAVTAAELAQAYGIEPRSARRLMTALQRAGIASPQGRQGGPRAGRPQIVYRIDVGRLVPMKGDPG
jgi:hypothetical protein